MHGPNWDDLRIVLAIYRLRTIAAAAKQLSMNESTVSRRLSQAEEWLQAKLFDRSPAGLSLTEAGRQLLQHVELAEREIETGRHAVSGLKDLIAGEVRVTSVPMIINHVLVPAVSNLLDEHVDLQIEFVADPADLSLANRDADIAVRLARPQSDMRAITQRIGTIEYGVYVSREFGNVGGAKALPWISYEKRMMKLPQAMWIAAHISDQSAELPRVYANDFETLLKCLKSNLGKSLVPRAIGDRDPDLVELRQDLALPKREVWLIVNADLRELRRTEVSVAWIKEVISDFFRPVHQQ